MGVGIALSSLRGKVVNKWAHLEIVEIVGSSGLVLRREGRLEQD